MVPFFSFLDAPIDLKNEWRAAISRVVDSGRYIGGSEVLDFENRWASFLDVNHSVGVANGMDAITLGLRSLGIGPGKLVAVPSHTFIATWLAVDAVGATPIGIDCDSTGLIDLDLLECLPASLDAVIPVHMHGKMVNMERLIKWARLKNVSVIEDCAQAHGADLNGRKAGTWGDVGAFSFYPSKNLGALGDAGIIATDDSSIAQSIKSLGNYGSSLENKYQYEKLGSNSRLDSIQAAVLGVNLKYLDLWNEKRREIAKQYMSKLIELDLTPFISEPENSVWHHFILQSSKRNELRAEFDILGISTEIHYPQCAEDSYAEISNYESQKPKVARKLAATTTSLPISPWMSETQINQVLDALSSPRILANLRSNI